jgi:hypothetical protein
MACGKCPAIAHELPSRTTQRQEALRPVTYLSRNTAVARSTMTHRMFPPSARRPASIELRFVHRRNVLQSLAFSCDAQGRVDLDALDERRRNQYHFARALMGRDYAYPVMASCDR